MYAATQSYEYFKDSFIGDTCLVLVKDYGVVTLGFFAFAIIAVVSIVISTMLRSPSGE